MSLGFKQVSEDLTNETKCEGSSLLTMEWLPETVCDWSGDLPQLLQGTAVLAPPLPTGGQILWCQPGVRGAAELRAGAGDGLTKTVCALGEKGVHCSMKTCHPHTLGAASTVPLWSLGH